MVEMTTTEQMRGEFVAWAEANGLAGELDVMTWEWKAWQGAAITASVTHQSEAQKLREEIADANENFDAIRNILHDTQAMVAVQREALKAAFGEVSDEEISVMIQEALSATTEMVAAWEAKKQCHPADCRDEMLWRKEKEALENKLAVAQTLLMEVSVAGEECEFDDVTQYVMPIETYQAVSDFALDQTNTEEVRQELTKREAAAKQAGRDEMRRELISLGELKPAFCKGS
jgi:hypothetical protein